MFMVSLLGPASAREPVPRPVRPPAPMYLWVVWSVTVGVPPSVWRAAITQRIS